MRLIRQDKRRWQLMCDTSLLFNICFAPDGTSVLVFENATALAFFFFSPPVLRQSIGSIIAVITWLLALGWFWYIYDIVLWVIKDNEADAKPVSVCEQVSNPEHIREKSLALLYCVAARVIIGCKHDSVCDTEDRCWIFKGTIHPKIKSTCFSSDPLCYLFK